MYPGQQPRKPEHVIKRLCLLGSAFWDKSSQRCPHPATSVWALCPCCLVLFCLFRQVGSSISAGLSTEKTDSPSPPQASYQRVGDGCASILGRAVSSSFYRKATQLGSACCTLCPSRPHPHSPAGTTMTVGMGGDSREELSPTILDNGFEEPKWSQNTLVFTSSTLSQPHQASGSKAGMHA